MCHNAVFCETRLTSDAHISPLVTGGADVSHKGGVVVSHQQSLGLISIAGATHQMLARSGRLTAEM